MYTPFIERNIAKIADAIDQSQQKKLAQGAYMGDPSAMAELAGVNPQLAQQIQQGMAQAEQRKLQSQVMQQNLKEKQHEQVVEIAKNSAQMPYEQARDYAANAAKDLGITAPPLTPEHHAQFVSAYGDKLTKFQEAQLAKKDSINPYQQAQLDIQNRRIDEQSQINDARIKKLENPAEKPIPPAAQKTIIENAQNLQNIKNAIDLNNGQAVGNLKGSKESTGIVKSLTPDFILSRTDPEGAPTRAAIANLKSMIVHDRSGSAVSVGEMKILKPFLPSEGDDQKTIANKLTGLYQTLENETKLYEQTYNSDQGYKNSPILEGSKNSAGKTGGVLHVDAKGNRAIVYPDGSFEEVK